MRVKRGKTHVKRRERLLKLAKGYRWGRKNKPKLAKVAVKKAGVYAYRDRRTRKREIRRLWQIQINAAARNHGLKYSTLIANLKKNKIELDRKSLADLAINQPKVFAALAKEIK